MWHNIQANDTQHDSIHYTVLQHTTYRFVTHSIQVCDALQTSMWHTTCRFVTQILHNTGMWHWHTVYRSVTHNIQFLWHATDRCTTLCHSVDSGNSCWLLLAVHGNEAVDWYCHQSRDVCAVVGPHCDVEPHVLAQCQHHRKPANTQTPRQNL